MTPPNPQALLKKLPTAPGVYQMIDKDGNTLYVGKAKNLKKRAGGYFKKTKLDLKTEAMVKQIYKVEVTITQTENEALLLENNLIKILKPRYNILFKDDKSYPYLYLSGDPYPRLVYYRGAKQKGGRYFGPYPNAHDLQNTLKLLQKIFKIRNCNNLFFKNRTRPCLQYDIKRCSAPCVGFIANQQYQDNVKNLTLFLEGKTQEIIHTLGQKMEDASISLDFEKAAFYRDQIAEIQKIQERQAIESERAHSLDAIGVATQKKQGAIMLLQVRGGRVIGIRRFLHDAQAPLSSSDLVNAFLPQYYFSLDFNAFPKEVILPLPYQDAASLENAIKEKTKCKLIFKTTRSGEKSKWLQMARGNAEQALLEKTNTAHETYQKTQALQQELSLPFVPQRIEAYDISHMSGESTTASCVVFTEKGKEKRSYRQYHIKNITPGDDYAALYQTFSRRFKKLGKYKMGKGTGERVGERLRGESDKTQNWPDLVLIDGGKGQLKQAEKALHEFGISNIHLIGVAKGEGRKPGLETLYISGRGEPLHLSSNSSALHFIQLIRDEAHRFAITRQRKQTRKKRTTSVLETIKGIGPTKRKALLQYFGGLEGLSTASVEALCKVPGVSKHSAEEIVKSLKLL